MSKFVARVAFVALALASLAVAPSFASAQESGLEIGTKGPAKPFSAGVLLDFGTDLGEDSNPWGLGFGVKGGYNLERLYLGVRFVYQLGSSADVTTPGLNTLEFTYNLWELSLEGGYDFTLRDKLTLRPSLLLGIVNLIVSSDGPVFGGESADASDTKLLIAPGASLLYDLTDQFFVGGDLRLPLLIGGGSLVGLVFYVNGGLHF
jgi:hypothetical protein